jgi:hypothetical protein
MLTFYPSRIPDPGVKKAPDPGSATLESGQAFHFNAAPNPDPTLHQKMGICDHWSIETPGLHCERPHPSHGFYFEPLKLQNFDFNADPDPDLAVHSNADPDPNTASKRAERIHADPGSQPCIQPTGSESFFSNLCRFDAD